MIIKRINGGWEHYKGSLGGIWEVWRGDMYDNHYNPPWEKVNLPHCFNAGDGVNPDIKYYQGQGWYKNQLVVDNPYQEGRTFLHFEGAGQKTTVYLYTQKVGSHIGGYDEFNVDITKAVKEFRQNNPEVYQGTIPVCVLTDNSRDLEMIPSDISDFNLYGGIYRNLNLLYLPAVSLKQVHINVKQVNDEYAEIVVRAWLYNPEHRIIKVSLEVNIKDPEGEIVHSTRLKTNTWQGGKDLIKCRIKRPVLWSPERPALYQCEVTLESNYGKTVNAENFGLRYFEFTKNGPFKLNGRRLLLRGTHRHEDHAGVGAAMTEDLIEKEMKMIKEMGVNFIRLAHYQQSRHVLELCDQLGILVWEEIPWCRGGLGGERYQKQACYMLEAMINQHYNHPSIIIWGLGNENDWEGDFPYFDKKKIRDFMRILNNIAHKLDPGRKTAIRRCEFCKDIVDVYSPSIWAGWYKGLYTEYQDALQEESKKVDHLLHVEWGADNLAARHVEEPYTGIGCIDKGQGVSEEDGDFLPTGGSPRISRDGDWSETYFCQLVDWHLKCQEELEWLTGSAQWPFKDFSTPIRPENPIPYVNLKGIVERDLTKKEAYYIFQSYWTKSPMIHIYGHTMPVRWGNKGEKKVVKVYSNCHHVRLYINDEDYGLKKRNSALFPAAGLYWEVVFNKGTNELHAIGKNGGIIIEDRIKIHYQTEKWGKPIELRLTKRYKSDEMVYIEVKSYDGNGIFCPDADFFIRFTLAGEGKLLDNLGTIRGSRYLQLSSGRAGIYVNPRGGASIVGVSAVGLKTVFIDI